MIEPYCIQLIDFSKKNHPFYLQETLSTVSELPNYVPIIYWSN